VPPESRQRKSAPRTTGRSELAKNPKFAELSPEVGELDLDALDAALDDDPDQTLTLVVEMSHATDEALRAAVRRLAPRLILDQTRRGIPRSRGVSKPRPVPAHRGGDLDLDRSMDAVVGARAEARMPGLDEMTAVEWARPDLAICLVIDHSGSMNGARLTTAAVTGAACLTFAPEEHAVLAFAAVTQTLRPLSSSTGPTRTIEQVLALRGHGTTGLAGALRAAQVQLAGARARRRVTLLLSDCRVTDEVDAVPAARALDELVILAPAGDDDEARRLARDAGARIASIGSVLEVPAALNGLLADDRL
jgi:Mg-chelatase subunit ChlD